MLETSEVAERVSGNNAPSSNLSADLSSGIPRATQLVHNIRALCSELNEAMRKATEEGFQVLLKNTPHLPLMGYVPYPVASVRVLLEVEPENDGS
jgi:hypothetical protein